MNKRSWSIIIIALVIIIGVGTYLFFRSFTGNNIEINSVIPDSTQNSEANKTTGNTSSTPAATSNQGGEVAADALNGQWKITDASKVYFSVTTSQETVNFENKKVSGNWDINVDSPSTMKGNGSIDMTANDSGNSQRDNHIQQADFFDVAKFPDATFTATSFENLPKAWTEGTAIPFKLTGKLKVKGIEKDVTFDAQAMYKNNQVMLSGKTKVTFSDFGMQNPHNVVLSTENDIGVQLELVLDKN
ncbi:YceI family protein [Paenibacillus turicensis]|uniref:YceI family protein n=1 Tax=Paenibacillus turicensis TaxID=160487 RepID=UPI003D293E6A